MPLCLLWMKKVCILHSWKTLLSNCLGSVAVQYVGKMYALRLNSMANSAGWEGSKFGFVEHVLCLDLKLNEIVSSPFSFLLTLNARSLSSFFLWEVSSICLMQPRNVVFQLLYLWRKKCPVCIWNLRGHGFTLTLYRLV